MIGPPNELTDRALELLKQLIAIPSFSGEEDRTATAIAAYLGSYGVEVHRQHNNVYAFNRHFDPAKPNLLLNSHHDTVRPNGAYTRDPFLPQVENGKLFGLGSNDAGGPLVSLLATFVHFHPMEGLGHNIIMAATAEEEDAGDKGIRALLPLLPKLDLAVVGEPTLMDLAIAEKGLIVFDAVVEGTPSHAAHPNGDNAIYKTIEVLQWFKNLRFDRVSEALGEVKLTVTQIHAGKQHNVVPAKVDLVVDVRVNDRYTNAEIAERLQRQAPCKMTPRSLRLNSSSIDPEHALVRCGLAAGRKTYGSPTLSDQAALDCQSVKWGPGDSTRSHSADEFIHVQEIVEGIALYIQVLTRFLKGSIPDNP